MSRLGRREFVKQIVGCLRLSRESFRSVLERPSLLRGTSIILTIAAIAAWAGYNYAGKMPVPTLRMPTVMGPPPIRPEQLRYFTMIGGAIGGLIGVPLIWLAISVLPHVLSKVVGGEGKFKNMLVLAAFASVPLLFQHLLRLIDSLMINEAEASKLAGTLQILADRFINAVANDLVRTFTVFGIWSAVLLAMAVRENYELSPIKSVIVVAMAYALIVVVSALATFFFVASPFGVR